MLISTKKKTLVPLGDWSTDLLALVNTGVQTAGQIETARITSKANASIAASQKKAAEAAALQAAAEAAGSKPWPLWLKAAAVGGGLLGGFLIFRMVTRRG